MRHAAAVAAVAAVIAVVLVLVVAEEEAGEDTSTVTATEPTPTTPRSPDTVPEPPAEEGGSDDVAQIEREVALYIEAVERGEQPAEGLPTTDELSILDIRVRGDRATVKLAGGARLVLRRAGGSWQVERVRPARTPPPTPPSDG